MALFGNKDTKAVAGTIAVTNGSGAVVGTSTAFTTGLKTGQTLVIDSVEYRVTRITSNTALVIAPVYAGSTASGLTVTANEQPAFISLGEMADVYFADATETSAGGDNVTGVAVATGGSGYLETPTVTFSGGGGASAAATATIAGGAVTSIAVTNVGSSYETVPTVAIAAPRRTIPTSGVTISTEQIAYTTHGLTAAEAVVYNNGGSTSITGLTSGTTYYVSALGLAAGTFRLAASASAAAGRTALAGVAISGTGGQFTCTATTLAVGDHIRITGTLGGTGTITGYTSGTIYEVSAVTGTSPSVTGFTVTDEAGSAIVTTAGTPTGLTYTPYTIVMLSGTGNNAQYFELVGKTATAVASKGSGSTDGANSGFEKITHSGWIKRTVGTGGRAGRVQYETLVAMGTAAGTSGDAADDLVLPDA
jgi:hypothetical protein